MLSINDPAVWLKELFTQAGLSYSQSSFLSTVALVLIVMLLSWLSNIIAKVIIRKSCHQNSKKNRIGMG